MHIIPIASVRRMAATLLVVAAFALSVTSSVQSSPGEKSEHELIVLTWSDYVNPELVEEFEHHHGVRVRFVHFESDQVRDKMLIASNGEGYDLTVADGSILSRYLLQDWLATIDETRVPNIEHMDPRWRDAYPGAREYAVPYFWGTLGIAYREDLVPEPITSWLQILQPHEVLSGRIAMIRDPYEMMTAALKALGHSLNSNDPQAMEAAGQLLLSQQPHVSGYSYVSITEESPLLTGEVAAAMMYNGDAMALQEQDERIVYVAPEEGSMLWTDYMMVLKKSPRKYLAYAFMDWFCDPARAARNAQHVYFGTTNLAAQALLPEDFLTDPGIYPGEATMSHSEFVVPRPPRAERRMNMLLTRLVD